MQAYIAGVCLDLIHMVALLNALDECKQDRQTVKHIHMRSEMPRLLMFHHFVKVIHLEK